MDNKNKDTGIKYIAVLLKSLEFERARELAKGEARVDLEFEQNNILNPEKTRLTCELTLKINPTGKEFSFTATMVGIFEQETNDSGYSLEDFMELNATAHLFPYLRELLSSTTVRAGLPPLVIPPTNLRNIPKKTETSN